MNNPKITYGITVCNEGWQLKQLLYKLFPYLQTGDQILIQSDETNVTDDVLNVIDEFQSHYQSSDFGFKHITTPLNRDFGRFKNILKFHATGDWIFQIDADEYPTESLLTSLLYLLKENNHADVILVPRINTVTGITQTYVDKWGWRHQVIDHPLLKVSAIIDEMSKEYKDFLNKNNAIYNTEDGVVYYHEPVINFPDYQWRLYKNKPNIKWVNKVHERLEGFEFYATLPADISWCLMHEKDIHRQINQNDFYDGIIKDGK